MPLTLTLAAIDQLRRQRDGTGMPAHLAGRVDWSALAVDPPRGMRALLEVVKAAADASEERERRRLSAFADELAVAEK